MYEILLSLWSRDWGTFFLSSDTPFAGPLHGRGCSYVLNLGNWGQFVIVRSGWTESSFFLSPPPQVCDHFLLLSVHKYTKSTYVKIFKELC